MRLRPGSTLHNGFVLGLLGLVACLPTEHRVEVNLDTGTGHMELFQGSSKLLDLYAKEGTVITFETDASSGVSVNPNPVKRTTLAPVFYTGTPPSVYASTTALGRHEFKINATNTNNQDTKTEIVPYVVTVLEPFSFSAASNTAVSGRIGQGITGSATTDRHPDFAGSITYTITGLPQELIPTIVPSRQGTRETVDFTIATQGAFPGTYPAQIVATSGNVVKTSALSVLVLAALPAPDFTMSVLPSAVLMQSSGTAFVDITLTRTGVPAVGAIDLTVAGHPNTVTASFQPARVVGATSRLMLVSNGALPAGPLDVVIQASSGSIIRTAVVKLTIAAPGTFTPAFNQPSYTGSQRSTVPVQLNLPRTGALVGAPLSVSVTASPPSTVVTPAVSSTTAVTTLINLEIGASTPIGPHTLTVNVTDGTSTQTATTTILVTAARPTVFAPAFRQASYTIPQDLQEHNFPIDLVRTTSLVGVPLTLTVSTAPPLGTTLGVTPSTTAEAAVMKLVVFHNTNVGSYPITVNITDGTTVWTATTTINIAAPMEPIGSSSSGMERRQQK